MNKYEAAVFIETLRSGIPSRQVAEYMCKGREDIIDMAVKDLQFVKGNNGKRSMIISGNYGEGKTHVLKAIFNKAIKENFVVSIITLSKETPFNRLDKVYAKIPASTYLPDSAQPGFISILERLSPSGKDTEALFDLCDGLHPKIKTLLECFIEDDDMEDKFDIYNDLAGTSYLTKSRISQIYKNTKALKLNMENFRLTDRNHMLSYFQFLDGLFTISGYSGWVILFDEVELIGRLGATSRAKAYLNMEPFILTQTENSILSHTYSVFSCASPFFNEVLIDKDEINSVSKRLYDPTEIKTAQAIVRHFIDKQIVLPTITAEDFQDILDMIETAHSIAYNWEAKLDREVLLNGFSSERLRSKIRGAIEYLDIEYLYKTKPFVKANKLDEYDMRENEDYYSQQNAN